MKGLTEEDLRMAKMLSKIIEKLDRIVFPKNPIEVLVLTQAPPNESERFRYCSQTPSFITDYKGELYLIFGSGLDKRIKEEQQKKIILFSEQEIEKETNDLLFLSQEEVLIGLASHEARHWLQHYFPERIFSPQQWQNTNYEYLKKVFRYVELLCEEIYTSSEEFKKEFDAAVIEHIVVEGWHHNRRNFSEIAKIVKSGPSELLELFNKFK